MRSIKNCIISMILIAGLILLCNACTGDAENNKNKQLLKAADFSETVYGPGLHSFKVKAGETNGHWIKINGAGLEILVSESGNSNFNIILKDGSVHSPYQDIPESIKEGFFIDAVSDSSLLINVR